MKQYIGLLAFALACGGEAFETEEEFGELEQEVFVHDTFGFRSDLSGSNTRCAQSFGGPNQTCIIPPDRAISTRITGTGMSPGEKTALEGIVLTINADWDSQLNTNWSFTLAGGGTGDVNVEYGTLTGGATSSIHRFARVTILNLSAPLDDQGLNGTWRKYVNGTGLTCVIDKSAINATWSNQLQRDRVRSHALYYCMQKAMGLGSSGSTVFKSYSISTTPDNAKDITLGSKVKCLLNGYDPGGSATLHVNGDCANVTDD